MRQLFLLLLFYLFLWRAFNNKNSKKSSKFTNTPKKIKLINYTLIYESLPTERFPIPFVQL